MKMRRGHQRYRDLISARFDGPLSVIAERQLLRHLARCAECRAVQNDYHRQRHELRGLRSVPPPRDMWARTSAALDRELARRPLPFELGQRRWLPRATVATAATLAVLMAFGTGQLGFVTTPQPQPEPRSSADPTAAAVLPTPFGVSPQRINLVGTNANGLFWLRTDVDQVCPPSALTCIDGGDLSPQIVALPRDVVPVHVSISPDGERMAITGRHGGGDGVVAIVLDETDGPHPPPDAPSPAVDSTPPPTDAPETTSPPSPTTSPDAPSPTSPDAPSPSEEPASAPPAVVIASPTDALPSILVSPAPSDSLLPAPVGSASPTPTLATVAILENVRIAGAPPAWSADGSTLAFSAMPADRSHGPDIYIWQPGDQVARPLTGDHGTYFASWSGGRIVASRVVVTAEAMSEQDEHEQADASAEPATEASDEPAEATEEPTAETTTERDVQLATGQAVLTVVIDLDTGEERVVAGAEGLWLPVVSPLGDRTVTWQGTFDIASTSVRLVAGALYLASWTDLNPFVAQADEATESPAPETVEPSETPAAGSISPRPRPMLTLPPDDEQTPDPTTPASPSTDLTSPSIEPDSPPPAAEPEPAATLELIALEPSRDPASDPVLDWQVRWSADGLVIGYWIADAAGASWGQLTVVAADAVAEAVDTEPLLPPVLARRNFTLGIDRVAWVGPADGNADGEIRIRTFGSAGDGGLRIPSLDLREVVPAF